MKGFYFEADQPHVLLWPVIAVGFDEEFWIGIGWLNFEFGWREGDGGETEADCAAAIRSMK
jgi:hypothetical protein